MVATLRETDIQNPVVAYARRAGCKASKYRSENRRDAPDYIFFYNGRCLLIEFKAPGKKARPTQLREIAKYRELGMHAYVVDDIAEGKMYIDLLTSDALYI